MDCCCVAVSRSKTVGDTQTLTVNSTWSTSGYSHYVTTWLAKAEFRGFHFLWVCKLFAVHTTVNTRVRSRISRLTRVQDRPWSGKREFLFFFFGLFAGCQKALGVHYRHLLVWMVNWNDSKKNLILRMLLCNKSQRENRSNVELPCNNSIRFNFMFI